MKAIAVQSYFKVEREIDGIEMKTVKQQREMILYPESLQTKHRNFPLHEVRDMSYREIAMEGGLLYVHTAHGVYSYTVASDPSEFVKAFKEHVRSGFSQPK